MNNIIGIVAEILKVLHKRRWVNIVNLIERRQKNVKRVNMGSWASYILSLVAVEWSGISRINHLPWISLVLRDLGLWEILWRLNHQIRRMWRYRILNNRRWRLNLYWRKCICWWSTQTNISRWLRTLGYRERRERRHWKWSKKVKLPQKVDVIFQTYRTFWLVNFWVR